MRDNFCQVILKQKYLITNINLFSFLTFHLYYIHLKLSSFSFMKPKIIEIFSFLKKKYPKSTGNVFSYLLSKVFDK